MLNNLADRLAAGNPLLSQWSHSREQGGSFLDSARDFTDGGGVRGDKGPRGKNGRRRACRPPPAPKGSSRLLHATRRHLDCL